MNALEQAKDSFSEHVFELQKMRANLYYHASAVQEIDLRAVANEVFEASITLTAPAKRAGAVVRESVEVPATWFDHLKARLGLEHKTKTIPTVTEQWFNMCPHLKQPSRDHINWLIRED